MHTCPPSPLVAAFMLSPNEEVGPHTSLHDARGDVQMTVEDWTLRLGQFSGAVLLLATAEELPPRLALLHRKPTSVELLIVGDVGPVWLRRVGKAGGYSLDWRGIHSPEVNAESIVQGFRQGIVALIQMFMHGKPWFLWTSAERAALLHIAAAWPDDATLRSLGR